MQTGSSRGSYEFTHPSPNKPSLRLAPGLDIAVAWCRATTWAHRTNEETNRDPDGVLAPTRLSRPNRSLPSPVPA